MEMSVEPSRLSMASRILLGGLLLANMVLLFYLFFTDPSVEEQGRREAVIQGDQRLVLVGELSEGDHAAMVREAEEEARTLTGGVAERSDSAVICLAWGPFANPEMLAVVRAQVELADPAVEVVATEIEAPPDFLVYLDSDDNLDNARRLLQELESQDIEAYVIAGGEYVNSVSAGVFSNLSGAEEVGQLLTDLGFTPRVQALGRSQQVSYLIGRVTEGFTVADVEVRPCEDIASLQ